MYIISSGKFEAVILDITILNIDYVAKKQTKDIRSFLHLINENFEIVGATNSQIKQALDLENSDLEDNLQYISAIEHSCDLIVSNDASFYSKDLEVVTSVAFKERFDF
jgi:predicted nucleic acid-binding protein